ncbi:transcription factor BIM2-like [Raphanus sativus]|uniref:Transcription factor BIM2-like n=1 Tax=Raphanus sativus TaxID=3726 RepID=A0A9W3D126_RAPSA|nr:transcription factor BIM2-like [Raphanus sativus]
MRAGKANQEEDDYGEEDFVSKREGPSSNNHNSNSAAAASRDAKENDKASAIRSKHSVTEQRRRSKINERFQILREIIPNSEQKRDTASFLLEVIDYVQYLQEKVQKYEGSYPGWSQEPTKLTPWRNNHWRVQSLANPPVAAASNGSVPVIPYPGKFEENTVPSSAPAIVAEMQNPVDSDLGRVYKPIDSQHELDHDDDKELPPVQPINHPTFVHGEQGDGAGQSNNDLVIEGGTISISTAYSHELLSSLTQALQNAGVDLSHAKLSVQIDLGKRANQGLTHNDPSNKIPLSSDTEGSTPSRGESEHAHKRVKTL